jgi:hypothetical protein
VRAPPFRNASPERARVDTCALPGVAPQQLPQAGSKCLFPGAFCTSAPAWEAKHVALESMGGFPSHGNATARIGRRPLSRPRLFFREVA